MSTHPTILGEMVKQQALGEDEKTSLDVERDLGLPVDAAKDQDAADTSRPALLDDERQPGERRQRIQSE
ncbi:hypothetical protein [Paracoccus salipaludis]|nr:hypothetical protein [Paracoccus salipaludis]